MESGNAAEKMKANIQNSSPQQLDMIGSDSMYNPSAYNQKFMNRFNEDAFPSLQNLQKNQ